MSAFIPNNERFALRFINGAYVVLDRVKFQNVAGPFHTIAEARKDAQRNGVQLVTRPALAELETQFNAFSAKLRAEALTRALINTGMLALPKLADHATR